MGYDKENPDYKDMMAISAKELHRLNREAYERGLTEGMKRLEEKYAKEQPAPKKPKKGKK